MSNKTKIAAMVFASILTKRLILVK